MSMTTVLIVSANGDRFKDGLSIESFMKETPQFVHKLSPTTVHDPLKTNEEIFSTHIVVVFYFSPRK